MRGRVRRKRQVSPLLLTELAQTRRSLINDLAYMVRGTLQADTASVIRGASDWDRGFPADPRAGVNRPEELRGLAALRVISLADAPRGMRGAYSREADSSRVARLCSGASVPILATPDLTAASATARATRAEMERSKTLGTM
jgi:hypothetical protein